jgi:diguanylate cyclase (GGDEF)-like protein
MFSIDVFQLQKGCISYYRENIRLQIDIFEPHSTMGDPYKCIKDIKKNGINPIIKVIGRRPMKVRIRNFRDVFLTGLIFLIMVFIIYQVAIQWNVFTCPKWFDGNTVIVLLIIVFITTVFFAFKQSRSADQVRQMEQLSELLKNTTLEEAVKLGETDPKSLPGEWVKILRKILDKEQQLNEEYQQKYNKLLYSYMHLEEKYAQSYTVQLILEEISRELDSDCLLKKTTDIIMGVFGSKKCTIYMKDEGKDELVVKASSEFNDDLPEKGTVSLACDSIIAGAWRNLRVYTWADTKPEEMAEFRKRNVNSILVIPLTGHRDCLGIMVIEHEMKDGLSPDLIEFAKLIAQELSLSVENAYLYGRMRRMANHDALTGIYNRMYLINYVAEMFNKKPNTASLIMFDMDFFKRINDRYGHLTGDMVLKTTTALIQTILPTGILARYGGEEFVIVLPEVGQDEAAEFGETIRRKISECEFLSAEGQRIRVTLSAGLANYPIVSGGYEGLLQKADEALYEAKKNGRNKLCVAEPG